MKICPTCQQQFPNGFHYCPNDTDILVTAEEFLRRTKPIAQTPSPVEASVQPASEFPALTRQPALEAPRVPVTEPVPPPTLRRSEPAAARSQAQAAPTTPVGVPASKAATGGITQPVPPTNGLQTNQRPANGNKATNGALAAAAGDGLALGGLLARLTGALQNISESFARAGGPVNPGDMGEFQFLLKEESLTARVTRELKNAADDFKRDPKAFVVTTIKGEGSSKQRQRWLLNSMAGALIAYSFVVFVIPTIFLLIWGNKPVVAEEKKEELEVLAALTELPTVDQKVNKPKETPKGKGGFTGGSKPTVKQASGGGGGGRQQETPPSKGVPPQMALTPQIIPPNPEPPKIKNPSLVVASTVYGDPKALPQLKGPTGDPLGVPAPPSSGPGTGAGIGTGAGTGVGRGQGGGVGPGRGGNAGGGDMDLGGGRGPGGSGGVEDMGRNGVGRPTILYREKAKYTEEARQNKVQGVVVLQVIFTADGRITNIRVVRGLPDGLTEKAIEAAQKIRFNPATKNGAPVSVRGTLEFSFNLY
jgi:TonB family protein